MPRAFGTAADRPVSGGNETSGSRTSGNETSGSRTGGDETGGDQHRGPPLRRRVTVAMLTVTALAMAAFAAPLEIALHRVERDRAQLRLAVTASQILATLPDERLAGAALIPAYKTISTDGSEREQVTIGLYDTTGTRVAGAGPLRSAVAADAGARATEVAGDEGHALTVALPLSRDGRDRPTIRVSEPDADLSEEFWENTALILALGVGILAVAGLVAFLLARRLTAPLVRLSTDAAALGSGDFTVRTRASGVREIDAVAAAFAATGERLGAMLERERAFSSDASHQIRSRLTALRLALEAPDQGDGAAAQTRAFARAATQLDDLEGILDHLLALAREQGTERHSLDLAPLLHRLEQRWAPQARRRGRELQVVVPARAVARGSGPAVEHILDVLVDNALTHGAGTVRVLARAVTGGLVVEVTDDGPSVLDEAVVFRRRHPAAQGHGIGLALARSLADADGGRLLLSRPGPAPKFSLVLPSAVPPGGPPAASAGG
jgi:signal transduction histidine kinase